MARRTTTTTTSTASTSDAPIVECIVSYVGTRGSFAAGALLRGDHPAVVANSSFWVPQADPGAKAAALMAIEAEINDAAAASARSREDEFRPQPGVARATRPLTYVYPGPDGAPRSETINKGETRAADDPVVARHPDYFDLT